MKRGWLVNDRLSVINENRTFLHDLLDAVPGLEPHLGPYDTLPEQIRREIAEQGAPDFIFRNASYFGPLETDGPRIIALLQDPMRSTDQVDVCREADTVVCCSNSMRDELHRYMPHHRQVEVIPIGIDFEIFKPQPDDTDPAFKSIVFVGSDNPIKGFQFLLKHIKKTRHRYLLIMKYAMKKPLPQDLIARVDDMVGLPVDKVAAAMRFAKLAVCTSERETEHLAGIEAGACGVPIVALNVGIYKDRQDGAWGLRATPDNFNERVEWALANLDQFSPRQYWLDEGLTIQESQRRWREVVLG